MVVLKVHFTIGSTHTLSSILSYIYLQPGSGLDPWITKEHLFFGCALRIISSPISSSSDSFFPHSAIGSVFVLNWTTNLLIRCPNGVTILDCLLDERRLPFVPYLESSNSSYRAKVLSVGVIKIPSLVSSGSSFKVLSRRYNYDKHKQKYLRLKKMEEENPSRSKHLVCISQFETIIQLRKNTQNNNDGSTPQSQNLMI